MDTSVRNSPADTLKENEMKKVKTDKAAVSKAVAASQARTAVTAHTTETGTPARFNDLSKDHSHMRAFMIAGAVCGSMIALSAKGTPTLGKKPNPALFRLIVGARAVGHWTKVGRILDGKFTAKGLNAVQASLTGNAKGYSTEREIVDAFITGIQKGGIVKFGDVKYSLKSVVTA